LHNLASVRGELVEPSINHPSTPLRANGQHTYFEVMQEVYFVNGISDIRKLSEALSKAKIIVTFNGTIFDIPFLKDQFPMLEMPSCHIDLRFFAKKAELSGGQKSIEEQLGVKRKKGLQQTDGYQATVLWDEYKWGKKTSLEKLIAYNHADVEGMKKNSIGY
jgi:uncharacterized protein YprB with RNaseH-like and TPR domain